MSDIKDLELKLALAESKIKELTRAFGVFWNRTELISSDWVPPFVVKEWVKEAQKLQEEEVLSLKDTPQVGHYTDLMLSSLRRVATFQEKFENIQEDCKLLQKYVTAMGPMCDEDCPGDDTCECSAKPIHEAVNRLCDLGE
jgi:hypothetical protein